MYLIKKRVLSLTMPFFCQIYNKSMNRYVSCCLTVKNIERNIFVLPREYRLDGTCFVETLYDSLILLFVN